MEAARGGWNWGLSEEMSRCKQGGGSESGPPMALEILRPRARGRVGERSSLTVCSFRPGVGPLLIRSHEETFTPEVNKGVELFEHVPTDSADRVGGNSPEQFSDLDYLEFM